MFSTSQPSKQFVYTTRNNLLLSLNNIGIKAFCTCIYFQHYAEGLQYQWCKLLLESEITLGIYLTTLGTYKLLYVMDFTIKNVKYTYSFVIIVTNLEAYRQMLACCSRMRRGFFFWCQNYQSVVRLESGLSFILPACFPRWQTQAIYCITYYYLA